MISNKQSYQNPRVPNVHTFEKLKWWLENLHLCNGWCLLQQKTLRFIYQDASGNGWEASCPGIFTGGEGVVKRAAEIIDECLGTISNTTDSTFVYQEIIRSIHLKIETR